MSFACLLHSAALIETLCCTLHLLSLTWCSGRKAKCLLTVTHHILQADALAEAEAEAEAAFDDSSDEYELPLGHTHRKRKRLPGLKPKAKSPPRVKEVRIQS